MQEEFFEVEWVQYQPNREGVLIGGYHRALTASGALISEFRNIATTQVELTSICPEGVTVWGDEEVAALVLEKTSVPCVFYQPPAPVEG